MATSKPSRLRRGHRRFGPAALVAVLTLCAGASAQTAPACDRACLGKALDRYLTGVIRHTPKAAALADRYRETENAVDTKAGDGLWKSLTGLGDVQRRYLDAPNQTAAYFGLVNEGTTQALLTLRIRVEGGKVAEAEWIIARQGEALFNPAGLAAEPPPQGPIPAKDRAPRADLAAAANSYFAGLQAKDGKLVHHVPGCVRLENGTRVTQHPAPGGPPAAAPGAANEFGDNDCASGLDRFAIREVAHRRFPVIDEVQGVALGYGMFLRPANSTSQRLLLSEVFITAGGKIHAIYAAMHYLPATAPETTGWPD